MDLKEIAVGNAGARVRIKYSLTPRATVLLAGGNPDVLVQSSRSLQWAPQDISKSVVALRMSRAMIQGKTARHYMGALGLHTVQSLA